MKSALIYVGTASLVVAGWLGIASLKSAAFASAIPNEPVSHPMFDPGRIDREIQFHQGRVRRDPKGALGWSMLSAAYLAKSREFDSDTSAWSAEDAARHSLQLRRKNNASAAKRLVSSLLEQHRFQDALQAVNDGLKIDPSDVGFTKLKIDILIEIGQIETAKSLIAGLDYTDPSAPTLNARILSLEGHHSEAAVSLSRAIGELESNRDVQPEDLAWYRVKIGNEWMAAKDFAKAEEEFAEALSLHPRNYKARLSMAKLSMARKDYPNAIIWGEKVIEVANSMEAKGIVADAELASGNTKGFAEWEARIVEQYRSEDKKFAALKKGGSLSVRPEDRMFATFCAEHKLRYPDALVAAKRDLANRPDELAKRNLAALSGL